MDKERLRNILAIGETVAVEFKRCGNGIKDDTYESVCSFLNRFGGDIFTGVLDDGTVTGIPSKAAPDMVKNFISCVSNPNLFSPTVYLDPEIIDYEGKTIIHVHVPSSAEVHTYMKVIYNRFDDADVKVTATSQIAQMYIRKQDIFTEKRIYPYVSKDDLRMDMLPKLRLMARNNSADGNHPWYTMTDDELLRSAHLYAKDRVTGEEGFNLAAIVLLGKDDVILDVLPAYATDALFRVQNTDRYDDREVIRTNLIDSYDHLMAFGRKHLPDKFFLEGDQRKSLREILTREMIADTLIHREFTSSYTAKFVIERDRMYVENACRSSETGKITPDNFEPNPKNPIIASFFRNIGLADQLGSGVRNLFKYSRYYSGKDPEIDSGDVFRIIVPLEDSELNDVHPVDTQSISKDQPNLDPSWTQGETKLNPSRTQTEPKLNPNSADNSLNDNEKKIIELISAEPALTQKEISERLGLKLNAVKTSMRRMSLRGILSRVGSSHKGYWKVNK